MTVRPPPTHSIEKVLKTKGGVRDRGERKSGNCAGEGVTYEVTQNAFWTVSEEDEKVAVVSLPSISGQG